MVTPRAVDTIPKTINIHLLMYLDKSMHQISIGTKYNHVPHPYVHFNQPYNTPVKDEALLKCKIRSKLYVKVPQMSSGISRFFKRRCKGLLLPKSK